MRISDWSSDVCSSDLKGRIAVLFAFLILPRQPLLPHRQGQDRGSLEQGQRRSTFGCFLRNLHSACSCSNHGNFAPIQINTFLRPARRVAPFALEILNAWDVRDIRLRREAECRQKEACRYGFPALKLYVPYPPPKTEDRR